MVNLQDTPSAGQISAADLDAARKHSTGRIVHLRRATLLPAGCDQQGRHATRQWPAFPDTVPTDWHGLDACAPEGGKRADPVPAMESMRRYRDLKDAIKTAAAILILLGLSAWGMHAMFPTAQATDPRPAAKSSAAT